MFHSFLLIIYSPSQKRLRIFSALPFYINSVSLFSLHFNHNCFIYSSLFLVYNKLFLSEILIIFHSNCFPLSLLKSQTGNEFTFQ